MNTYMAINSYHPHTPKSGIDRWIYLAVIAGPIMTIPQIYDIWVRHKTDVSLVSWIAYLIIAGMWLLYGVKHADKPIIAVQAIWIITDIAVITGLLLA